MSIPVNIGDFAEQLLMTEGQAQSPTTVPVEPAYAESQAVNYGNTPDISEVQVPSSFVSTLVEGKSTPLVEDSQPVSHPQPVAPLQPLEEHKDILYLIEEVRSLLEEVKDVLTEVTSVGMGGVGQAATPAPKKEKNVEDLLNSIMKKRRKAAK